MIDENAFGVLLSHYDLESIEYSLEQGVFVEYLRNFSALIDQQLVASSLAHGIRSINLGHARYLEFSDGDQVDNPIQWIREMRKAFISADYPNVCILSAGGRWVTDISSEAWASSGGTVDYGPSEPLRKSLAAEAYAQPNTSGEDETAGFGPGLYIEKEAIEQLGKALKNAPTALPVLSSIFYRIGA